VSDEPRDDFTNSVIAVIAAIPPGTVTTYGEIAAEAGYPGAARAVGNLLRVTSGLPWWRVIAASGRLVPDNEVDHAQRLRAEGVRVVRGKVVMKGNP
jgi:methylated-DNA-protein-cysteine methyltransferase related protein